MLCGHFGDSKDVDVAKQPPVIASEAVKAIAGWLYTFAKEVAERRFAKRDDGMNYTNELDSDVDSILDMEGSGTDATDDDRDNISDDSDVGSILLPVKMRRSKARIEMAYQSLQSSGER